ncbi:hypothetical protein KBC75_00455 [Candidatus Shapirobacteria bacterium]|nr:hypothetical protein [Candidatus Shapirobacteria bacterium]
MFPAYLSTLIFLILLVISWRSIRRGKQIAEFTYSWAFLIGAFVWEDIFIFSLYGLIASIITVVTEQLKFGLFFFLIFWVIRSAGETLYFFLQQFLEPKHFPHYIDDRFQILRYIFGNISYQQCLIIMQVFFQIIMMFSTASLILLLFNWHSL